MNEIIRVEEASNALDLNFLSLYLFQANKDKKSMNNAILLS